MFIDQADITVKAGDGGHGSVSFRRERFIPRGGPDGGDGGNGGSVYVKALSGVDTLLDFTGRHDWSAQRGQDGMGQNRHGKNGEDLIIQVPTGTIITDVDRDLVIKDMNEENLTVCVARGGRGGRGNKAFASPTNQVPRDAEQGKPGQQRRLHLELKLIADVGLVGLPNAGKSTLLSRVSAARPKIADYPFTTIEPNLGIVELTDYRRFVVADIPGLIEGSHTGHGLGHDFLRHIERTRILVHLIDITETLGDDPLAPYHLIRNELTGHSPTLGAKPEMVVLSKQDLDVDGELFERFRQAFEAYQQSGQAPASQANDPGGATDATGANTANPTDDSLAGRAPLLTVSSATGAQVGGFCERLWRWVQAARDREAPAPTPREQTPTTPLPAPPHRMDPTSSQPSSDQ